MEKNRKNNHIKVSLKNTVEMPDKKNGFEYYDLKHSALPDFDFTGIDTKIEVFGKKLNFPLIITAITGGSKAGEKINKNLAKACQKTGIALGLGSQKILFKNPETLGTFQVRKEGPDIFLLGNLGLCHLKEFGIEFCINTIKNIKADGIAFYLNPLHELAQEKGNPCYSDLTEPLKKFCRAAPFPVIIKETGNGISKNTAIALENTGIAAIDISGAGGTSCVMMEYNIIKDPVKKNILKPFFNWGIPTAEALVEVRKALPDMFLIASGGIRNGIECAKAIALGADLAGMALPFLEPASISSEKVEEKIYEIIEQFKIAMFCAGAKDIKELRKANIIYKKY